ncbi:MAG TPA: hypothetical protein VFZ23_16740 [Pyrinomonadaceae bacterium]
MKLSVLKFTLFLLVLPAALAAQSKNVKPLPADASLGDTQKWLVAGLSKYASFKTRVNSASVSSVKFDGCKLSYTIIRRSGSTAHDTMGATTRTHIVKQDVAFDLSFIANDGVKLTDHIYPDFRTITIAFRSDQGGDVEIVVKHEAGEPIRSALDHARTLCIPKS